MKIFVAKLNYDTTDSQLQSHFEQFGTVESAKIIMDRETGRSRGFGFVEMADSGEAEEAIQELDDTEFDGRTIVVKEAEDRSRGGGSRGGNRRPRNNNRGFGRN